MKKHIVDLKIVANDRLGDKHILMKLTSDEPLPEMRPGQFVEVRVDHSASTFLRRPISINYVDKEKNELWLLIQVVGEGTRQLATMEIGDKLNLVLPLGNGFSDPQPQQKSLLLIGGGVGVAPLLQLGNYLKQKGFQPMFLLGARTYKDLLLMHEFEKVGRVLVTTEDGTAGEKGFVTNHSILTTEKIDKIYSCGPTPMMKAVASFASKSGIDCEVSLENKMACGLGACLCCVTETKEGHKCVCSDGPVFNIKDLTWQI
ncbi:MAG: dihydroorotate dehydrogenase electron transfer subunit [Bacteroidales bacterium]|nr:dihydroorotate dehydrogenase electron transfer subunit [Bacteroidales bacterium]